MGSTTQEADVVPPVEVAGVAAKNLVASIRNILWLPVSLVLFLQLFDA